jgi:hypothetical protein
MAERFAYFVNHSLGSSTTPPAGRCRGRIGSGSARRGRRDLGCGDTRRRCGEGTTAIRVSRRRGIRWEGLGQEMCATRLDTARAQRRRQLLSAPCLDGACWPGPATRPMLGAVNLSHNRHNRHPSASATRARASGSCAPPLRLDGSEDALTTEPTLVELPTNLGAVTCQARARGPAEWEHLRPC